MENTLTHSEIKNIIKKLTKKQIIGIFEYRGMEIEKGISKAELKDMLYTRVMDGSIPDIEIDILE